MGVSIALDDFGIGYSSLTSLEQLPITRVKLDRMLVESVDSSPRSAAIARSIIALCHGLGLQVDRRGRGAGTAAGVPVEVRAGWACRVTCSRCLLKRMRSLPRRRLPPRRRARCWRKPLAVAKATAPSRAALIFVGANPRWLRGA